MGMNTRAVAGLALALVLVVPAVAQRAGRLRTGAEVKGATPDGTALACRPLYLPIGRGHEDILLDYITGDLLPLVEGYFAYRACRLDSSVAPPQPTGLGPWAVVDVAARHVRYQNWPYYVEGRSTPAWRRNLVAYWGVFGGRLEAVVADWQLNLMVERTSTDIELPPGSEPLPAPRWVHLGREYDDEPRVEARFEFAGERLRLALSPRVLR